MGTRGRAELISATVSVIILILPSLGIAVPAWLKIAALVFLVTVLVWALWPATWQKGFRMTPAIALMVVGAGTTALGGFWYFASAAQRGIVNSDAQPEPANRPLAPPQTGGQNAASITNNGPVFNAPVYGAGGAGGSPAVTGNNNVVIGGNGGEGGVGSGIGGAGGAGHHVGDNMIVKGGNGGGAPQADGRGGRGGRSSYSHDPVLPDGHRLSDFGRGGDGASSPEYLRYHWVALTPEEMVEMRDPLRAFNPEKVTIACNDGNCSELGASFVDFFDRLGWAEARLTQAFDGNANGLTVRPNNETTRAIARAIERTTKGRLQVNTRPYLSEGEEGIIIAIGRKPPP